jgi:hypothetical protein
LFLQTGADGLIERYGRILAESILTLAEEQLGRQGGEGFCGDAVFGAGDPYRYVAMPGRRRIFIL